MARKKKKENIIIQLAPTHELISKIRRGGRPDQVHKNKRREANKKCCRKLVDY